MEMWLSVSHLANEDPDQPKSTRQEDEEQVEEEVQNGVTLSARGHFLSFHRGVSL